MKQYKGKVIAAAVIFCVLATAYFWGSSYPVRDGAYRADAPASMAAVNTTLPANTAVPGETVAPAAPGVSASPESSPSVTVQTVPKETGEAPAPTGISERRVGSGAQDTPPQQDTPAKTAPPGSPEPSDPPQAEQRENSSEGVYNGSVSYSQARGMALDSKTGKDKYLTNPVPAGKPVPVEPQDAVIKDTAYTCTLSVRCETLLKNMKYLDKEKVELVPEDGVIFPATKVTFYEGESVFNVLQRELKKNKVHMEFENIPLYNSAYIEGIHNLYQFDAGPLSGWLYKVNGWFPNYGCSRYRLKDGDVVEWVYTCDLGRDVGGYYATGGEE